MDGEKDLYRRGKQLFGLASDLAPGDRLAFLERECGGDRRLREHVERLLELDADGDAGPEPLVAVGELFDRRQVVGERVGRYRIVRRLGAGGMGTVYEAEQDHPRRSVALKLMHEALASGRAQRRFAFEIEVLGRLQHPGIAHVYEAGTVEIEGRATPYFAMELVREARSVTGFSADRSLGLRERVELFARVCDAVQHGHQNGVVHRDLKPANILVDGSGQPKVIDFGVARSTNSDLTLTTLRTHAGELLGTLGYMSPEQCEADPNAIDTRSDVYSLGVVLYELLCGGSPYDLAGLSIPAATRVIRDLPPRPPSAVNRAVKGDLEAILLKALSKDRGRRYASAASFAEDLRRHLAGQAIEARLPDRLERLVGWSRRHPVVLTAGVCLAIVGAAAFAMWFGVWRFGRRAFRIEIGSDRSFVTVRSRAGAELHRWDLGAPGAVAAAEVVGVPGQEPKRVVVIAPTNAARWAGAGELCAFDLEEPGHRLWTSASTPLVAPPDEPDRPEARFACERMVVDDVFEACHGPEILVTQRLSLYSATAISIFDLSGRLRYRAWNDAPVTALDWLPGARRLVASSADTEEPWPTVASGGSRPHPMYPAVVFALEPELDRRGGDWIVRSGAVRDDTLRWYRWLGPAERLGGLRAVHCGLHSDLGTFDASSHCGVWFLADTGDPALGATLNFVLDPSGRVVRRWVSDGWSGAERAGALPPSEPLALLSYDELGR
jgi:hypothetical protein